MGLLIRPLLMADKINRRDINKLRQTLLLVETELTNLNAEADALGYPNQKETHEPNDGPPSGIRDDASGSGEVPAG